VCKARTHDWWRSGQHAYFICRGCTRPSCPGCPAVDVSLYLFDLIGVAVFAISGALAAGRRRLDLRGVVVAAAATAVGGGTIRDVLLNRHPIFWLTDARYLLVIIVASIATMLYVRWARVPGITLDVADALGLALFTVTGAQVAERAGMPAITCVLLGTMSGAAGGVIRDVLLAQVPLILQRGSLYATAAIVGATFYLVLIRLGISPGVASLAGMACVASLRLAAIFWRLELPAFEVPLDES
jgi:uncharacterized membrane protein YeiH